LIARLADLACGDVPPVEARESKRHLAGCDGCSAYRRTYGTTVELARDAYRSGEGSSAEMPEALTARILAAARTRPAGPSPRAWHFVHLLSGIAAGPLLAFFFR
jgi:hypothetical protein